MDLLEWIEHIFSQYGYFVLLVGIPLDFIALPIPPGQTTLTVTGYLVNREVLLWLPAILAAFLGSSIGITVTYLIGYKAGQPLLKRFSKRKRKSFASLQKAQQWHERYGHKVLLFSFFIPGFRQFYGYYMGVVRVPYRKFALYGYTGAAIWVTCFFGIGYYFADQWQVILTVIGHNLQFIATVLVVLIIFTVIYKSRFRIVRMTKRLFSKEVEIRMPKSFRLFFRAKDRK